MMARIETKPLVITYAAAITRMDRLSGFKVRQWVEDADERNDESWGAYLNHQMIGYCTIGYADDQCPVIRDHELWARDAYQLSDVFIMPEYRHNGYGTQMIQDAIRGRYLSEGIRPVFLQALNQELMSFYQMTGFMRVENYMGYNTMILRPEDLKGGLAGYDGKRVHCTAY